MKTKSKIRLSSRVERIQTSPTLLMLNRAADLIARGVDVVDFGPGEPDFGTPKLVGEAGKTAIDNGLTKYTNSFGTTELRNAVASTYNRRYGTSVDAKNVIVGTGGKQELFNLALAFVSDGDEVVIPSPYWVSFPDQVLFAGGKPVFAPCDEANHFRPTFDAVARAVTGRTRGVIINSPCNPTGAVIEAAELRKIVELCASRDMFVVFDETYEFFVYGGGRHVSAAELFNDYPETIVIVNSMSKTYAMTGWRIGFAVAHPSTIAAIGKIQSHSTSNPSSISQAAALNALQTADDEVHRMYDAYVERRAWLVPALRSVPGFECAEPDGAFYVFPRVRALYGRKGVTDSASLASYLLEEARVSVVPGSAFGADDYIRLSYATSLQKIKEGVERIRRAAEKLLA